MNETIVRQSTAVAIGGRAVLIEGPPGSGKTSLALALIDRGAALIGDDGVKLHGTGRLVTASPPPKTRGMIEIRNVGIAQMPVASAPVCLIVTLDQGAPRFVETAETFLILNSAIPHLKFSIGSIADAVRLEHALELHGLPSP